MNWSQVADVAKTLAAILGIGGGGLALWQFVHANRAKRAEWLVSLHEKFFEMGRYARVRRALDYKSEPDYSALKTAVERGQPHELADDLYRYLNFFELLAGLRKLRQISESEILILFDYDLRMIRRHDFVVDALQSQGFEQLHALLGSMKPA